MRWPDRTVMERLHSHVIQDSITDCWLWTGYRTKNGAWYGVMKMRGNRQILVHRLSWELYVGEIPVGLHVLHHCDVPNCVNPGHLFIGTQRDNVRDMWAKKSLLRLTLRGSDHSNSKLSESQVRSIKLDKRSQRKIAKAYRVSPTTISKIKRNKRYHLQTGLVQHCAREVSDG